MVDEKVWWIKRWQVNKNSLCVESNLTPSNHEIGAFMCIILSIRTYVCNIHTYVCNIRTHPHTYMCTFCMYIFVFHSHLNCARYSPLPADPAILLDIALSPEPPKQTRSSRKTASSASSHRPPHKNLTQDSNPQPRNPQHNLQVTALNHKTQ